MPGSNRGVPDPWPLGVPPSLERPIPQFMHALTIRRDRYGPPASSIRIETVPAPSIGPLEARHVLVAVLATGPNFNTNFAALGLPVPVFGRGDAAFVHVPGSDAMGIVVDAGPAVTRVKAGQAVVLDSWTGRNIRGYETHNGFNAQFVAVPEERAIPLPDPLRAMPPERLAAMLLTYGTAYRAVVSRLRVRPGDSVLVMGGGKGTSFAGCQLCKLAGARVILVGSNPELARSLAARGMADAFIDRRSIPASAFGPIEPNESYGEWAGRAQPFRSAVFEANGGRPVDKIFEHTGGANFPLLVSVLADGGALAFFGATGRGLKGEYRETFFGGESRFVFDARWVWMRQKQIVFRRKTPGAIFDEIGLPPGRCGLVWGADVYARSFIRAALERGAELAVIASRSRERAGIARIARMGVPGDRVIDRDALDLPADMPDPLLPEGAPNPAYAAAFMKKAQALGKAVWGVLGPRRSPDFVVERPDQSTLHFSTFVLRDFDEREAMPCAFVVARAPRDLSILGSHMYDSAQAAEVIRLLAAGRLTMEQDDLEIVDLPGLPALQQKMLDGTMARPKGVALVQADCPGRAVASYEDAYLGEAILAPDPARKKYLDVRMAGEIAVLALTRPDALNALDLELLDQLDAVVRELRSAGTIAGRRAAALVIRGAGRAFAAGADVNEFLRRSAAEIEALAARNIAVFREIENLPIPVVALVDGFALGGGNELAMCAHYRIVTENASLGQPEVKLGIIPGYGGMQRLPRLVGPARAARMCANGEPVDGRTAAEIGLADEFCASSRALVAAVRAAAEFAAGRRRLAVRDWDGLAAAFAAELDATLAEPSVRAILSAPPPDAAAASDAAAARRFAARSAIEAMEYGFRNGFSAGLANDARVFGAVAASPGGQEWIGRFLAKDPVQSSFMAILDPIGER